MKYSDLNLKENIGRGSVGDYYQAMWNGKEVFNTFGFPLYPPFNVLLGYCQKSSLPEVPRRRNLLAQIQDGNNKVLSSLSLSPPCPQLIFHFSKIFHPNLVKSFGICLQPGNIALVQEFMPKGNLNQLLSNNSISLTWPIKYKIAKQVLK